MKNTDIESLLRDSRPQVQDNPAFLLEVQQKMRAVEGIKKEVDRQRRSGRRALAMAPGGVDPGVVEVLREMIGAAVNEPMRAADADASETMSKLTGGLGLSF